MRKVSLLFPGQGSQYIGMGKGLADQRFNQASEVLNFNLRKLCNEGPAEELKLTYNTQPAIVTHSIALYDRLMNDFENKIEIHSVLGHSVGEFSALVAAKTLSFADAIRAVRKRGQLMQEAVPAGIGGMKAVLKLPQDLIAKACEEVSKNNPNIFVSVANYNDPMQTVISGHIEGLELVQKWLEENSESKFRGINLPVSAPFHCALMKPAADGLAEFLKMIKFNDSELNYMANIDAKMYPLGTSGDTIKENLIQQVCGSVLWEQSIKQLPEGLTLIEVGPGKVLQGLVKKIRPDLEVFSLDKDGFDFLN